MTRPKHLWGLGFRDIKLFNLSLLPRQSRRILQEPNSLSTRLLKAIYFPNVSILEAELAHILLKLGDLSLRGEIF
jgi:hypothetical protein